MGKVTLAHQPGAKASRIDTRRERLTIDDPLDASPRELVSALVRSNAELAALSSGLKALARELEQTSSPELAGLDVLVAGLTAEVGQHLASAAPQIAALPASWRRPARHPG